MTAARARRAIVDTVRWLMSRRLYTGTSGNVSARSGDGLARLFPERAADATTDGGAR